MTSTTQSSPRKHGALRLRAILLLQGVFAVALLLEGAACFILLHGPLPPSPARWGEAALLHTLAAAVPLCYAYRPDRFPGAGWYLPKLTGLITFFLPALGIVGMTLTINMTKLFVTSKGLAHEFDEKTFRLDTSDATIINRSMDNMLRQELATQPIVDILLGDDDDLKRGAIMLLKRMKSSRAVTLLKESLSNPSTEVRFFAHTALTQLEEDAMDRLEKAEEKASSGDSHAMLSFAEVCRDYARSGLPEDSMRRYYFESARTNYERYVAKEKQDHRAYIEIGLINLELGDYAAAQEVFTKALDYPETFVAGRLGRCRIFFEQHKWDMLALEMTHMRAHIPTADEADDFSRALYTFWAQTEGHAEAAA